MKGVYSKRVYQVGQSSFWKAELFQNRIQSEQALLENLATFDIKPNYVQEKSFRNTDTSEWIRKRLTIWASNSSNFGREASLCLCEYDSHHLVTSFKQLLEKWFFESKVKNKETVHDIETVFQNSLDGKLESLSQTTWTSHWKWSCLVSALQWWQLCFHSIT